jgi:hypothetical protein
MAEWRVTWVGGAWFIMTEQGPQRIEGDGRWVDHWLAQRGSSRADLDFGDSTALEQAFISDYGPAVGRRPR